MRNYPVDEAFQVKPHLTCHALSQMRFDISERTRIFCTFQLLLFEVLDEKFFEPTAGLYAR
jgi:hypothetical protein